VPTSRTEADILSIRATYKLRLSQASVMRMDSVSCVSFRVSNSRRRYAAASGAESIIRRVGTKSVQFMNTERRKQLLCKKGNSQAPDKGEYRYQADGGEREDFHVGPPFSVSCTGQ
jgi:hypothetical protein